MQLLSTMALTMVTSLNKVALQRLVAAYGSAQAVFDAAGDPDAEPQMDPALAKQLATSQATLFQRAEQELEYICREGVRTYCWGDADYPQRLAQCADAPLILFGRGKLPVNRPRQLAVVGIPCRASGVMP